jgi:enoyl reductase-like protein
MICRELMEALKEYGRLECRNLEFNPVDCSWADVFKELDRAEEAAAGSEQGDKRFLINHRRKLSTMSKSIMPLLDALPDELCVLHGGLAVIFHVCIALEDMQLLGLTYTS